MSNASKEEKTEYIHVKINDSGLLITDPTSNRIYRTPCEFVIESKYLESIYALVRFYRIGNYQLTENYKKPKVKERAVRASSPSTTTTNKDGDNTTYSDAAAASVNMMDCEPWSHASNHIELSNKVGKR